MCVSPAARHCPLTRAACLCVSGLGGFTSEPSGSHCGVQGRASFPSRPTWILNLARPTWDSGTFSELLGLSEPQFSHLPSGANSTHVGGSGGLWTLHLRPVIGPQKSEPLFSSLEGGPPTSRGLMGWVGQPSGWGTEQGRKRRVGCW